MTPNIYTRHILIILVLKLYSFYYKIIYINFNQNLYYIYQSIVLIHVCSIVSVVWVDNFYCTCIQHLTDTNIRDLYLHSCTCLKTSSYQSQRSRSYSVKHYLLSSNTFFNCPDSCILISSFSPPIYFVPINSCGTCQKSEICIHQKQNQPWSVRLIISF